MTSHPTSPPERSADVGYETTDVYPRTIIWFAVAIVLAALVVQTGLWFLLVHFRRQAAKTDVPTSPLARSQPERLEPHLQSAPNLDYERFRQSEERRLDSYGWADKQQRTVHIPISRAMDLILERGLPEVPASESIDKQPLQRGTATPTSSLPQDNRE